MVRKFVGLVIAVHAGALHSSTGAGIDKSWRAGA
jgi:hypothetical protein